MRICSERQPKGAFSPSIVRRCERVRAVVRGVNFMKEEMSNAPRVSYPKWPGADRIGCGCNATTPFNLHCSENHETGLGFWKPVMSVVSVMSVGQPHLSVGHRKTRRGLLRSLDFCTIDCCVPQNPNVSDRNRGRDPKWTPVRRCGLSTSSRQEYLSRRDLLEDPVAVVAQK